MKVSAPYLPVVGSQSLVKIFVPSVLNHDEACWLVETAIRTRITSTSRPAASARIWKPRSPSGRRSDSGRVDPAGTAGSTRVAAPPTSSRSDLRASQRSLLHADLAQLRLGHRVDVGGNLRVAQAGQQVLAAAADQVADPGLKRFGGSRAPLSLIDQI